MNFNTFSRIFRWRAPALVTALSLMGASQAFSHGVQIAWGTQSDGSIRVYIEHFHGDKTLSQLGVNDTINVTTTSISSGTQTLDVAASGTINNTSLDNLPGCSVQALAGCPVLANNYNDWGYWDFSPGTSADPVTITINKGDPLGLFVEIRCYEGVPSGVLYPQTLTGQVDSESPVITTESSMIVEIGDEIPAAATTVEELIAQNIIASDNVTPNEELVISVVEESSGSCPLVITRTYSATDLCGNISLPSVQTITVNSGLFAEDGILWHQPLARNGMSDDTDPSGGGTLKFRFKLGRTIPIKIHALGCDGIDVTGNSNVTGTVVVYGDTNMDGVADGNGIAIDYNGVGGAGGAMDKVGKHLHYNLDTKTLKAIANTKCYLLEVTITDTSTGETVSEMIPLQAK